MRYYLLIFVLYYSCTPVLEQDNKETVNLVLNQWHQAAANADFDTYFSLMTDDAHFIGTDATENWNKAVFMKFSKPFFDKGKAWDFKVLDRNVYFDQSQEIAWFDERLNTWMGICRGSGVLVKNDKNWKIKHYVLAVTIPNETIDTVIKINKSLNKKLLTSLN